MSSRIMVTSFSARPPRRIALCLGLLALAGARAQFPGGPPAPPKTAKAAALYDITGYWVSVVTEDWRFRMVTPPKGDYTGVLLNPQGRKLADAWDPAKDETAGEQCKSYGAPILMSVPGRLHVTWQDDQTLKMESDAGEQTRLFHFAAANDQGPTWQGFSKALWERVPVGRGVPPVGSLKVITTRLRPGYLRKNGVPYSANTTLTEYFDLVTERNGDAYLVVTTTVEDPVYLVQPYLTASHYRKQPDAKGWNPKPCSAR
ncbi:MAG TPA: hypothetical protein VMH80_12425 [Bryobacteraceae bacterium]|nr:hypothetical protein [Bryobacteraceae bacterium]